MSVAENHDRIIGKSCIVNKALSVFKFALTAASKYGKWFKKFGSIILVPGNKNVYIQTMHILLITHHDRQLGKKRINSAAASL
jgi:hypothetical protein